jgi:hypothetical protein
MTEPSVHEPKRKGLGPGGWFVVAALVLMLGAAVWFMVYAWNLTDAQIDTNGYIALTLGVVMTTLLGGGLMALVFWSNRKGYDR